VLSRLAFSLADTQPDDVRVAVRRMLVTGRPDDAALTLIHALRRGGTTIQPGEEAMFHDALVLLGLDPGLLDGVPVGAAARPVPFRFEAATWAETDADVLGRLTGSDGGLGGSGVLGVWRAYRIPDAPTPWPPPRRCYLVETADDTAAAAVEGRFAGAHPDSPLVDAYVTGTRLTPLYRAFLDAGSLVHCGVRDPGFTVAELFDGTPGPDGRPQHLVEVAQDEADRLLGLLRAGRLVARLPCGPDALGPGCDVPLDLRTDGRWIWSDASAYYLEHYRVAPPRAFLAELRARNGSPAPPPDVLVHLARSWVRRVGLV
jgi:hypothetical protein